MRLTTIATHIEIEKEQANFYYRLKDEFGRLCECRAIWDIKAHQATDKFQERTTANLRVNRARVTFALDSCELIRWDEKVPHMQNTKGGDFYLYPGFILYRASKESFSVIEYHDVKGTAVVISFQEEEAIPADTKIIGQAWAKANKDGSQDRRFAENYQIPVALYGQVTLKSDSGLWEEFQFSNPELLLDYLKAFDSSRHLLLQLLIRALVQVGVVGLNPTTLRGSMRSTRQLSITLPNEMAEIVRAKVAAGEYATESEVVRDGLRTLLARDRAFDGWLREQVAPAYDAMKAAPSRAVSADQVRATLSAKHRKATTKP